MLKRLTFVFVLIQLFCLSFSHARGVNELGALPDLNEQQIKVLKFLGSGTFDKIRSGEIKFYPLAEAVILGDEAKVTELLQQGAEIDAPTPETRFTALHWAVYLNRPKLVLILLENGAQIEAQTSSESTPLYLASGLNHVEIIRLLAKKQANLRAKRKLDLQPVSVATMNGHKEALEVLLEIDPTLIQEKTEYFDGIDPMNLLMFAASQGRKDIVDFLLAKGMNLHEVTPPDANGDFSHRTSSALMEALRFGHVDLAKHLFDRGAQIATFDKTIFNILASQRVESLFFLLEHYPDLRFSETLADGSEPTLLGHIHFYSSIPLFIEANLMIGKQFKKITANHITQFQEATETELHLNFYFNRPLFQAVIPYLSSPDQEWIDVISIDLINKSWPNEIYQFMLLAAAHGKVKTVQYLVNEKKLPVEEALTRVKLIPQIFPDSKTRLAPVKDFLETYSANRTQVLGDKNDTPSFLNLLPADLQNLVFSHYRNTYITHSKKEEVPPQGGNQK